MIPGDTLIDTYPAFLEFWAEARSQPVEDQIEGWAGQYMTQWPELFKKQVQDYQHAGLDWRQAARERIFPYLEERQASIMAAHENLLRYCGAVFQAAQERFAYFTPTITIIYVGIGSGAGWATNYQGSPALLFGLENIVEEGWSQPPAINGLIAHELGHLIHNQWRAEAGKATGLGPWWQMVEEGFAMRCEQALLGENSWHMAAGAGYKGWLKWCRENKRWLAAEFLRRSASGEDIRPFFGSWFNVKGQKQTGYYLGCELVKKLETHMTLKEIAIMDDYEGQMHRLIIQMAGADKFMG